MYVFGIFVKYQKVVVCGRAFGSTSCSIDLHDSFSARAMLLLLLLSNIRHKFQVEILPALFFFWLWVALATQGLCGSIGVLGYFCLSLKYVVGVLAGTALNLQVASVRMFFFIIILKNMGVFLFSHVFLNFFRDTVLIVGLLSPWLDLLLDFLEWECSHDLS